jgi:hypothetical protein
LLSRGRPETKVRLANADFPPGSTFVNSFVPAGWASNAGSPPPNTSWLNMGLSAAVVSDYLIDCPLHPLAQDAAELVCGLNHAFIDGLIDGLQANTVAAVLAPTVEECCAELRGTSPKT